MDDKPTTEDEEEKDPIWFGPVFWGILLIAIVIGGIIVVGGATAIGVFFLFVFEPIFGPY